MKEPRPLATVTVEQTDEGSVVVLRTDRGARLRYGPFSVDGVEPAIMHLGSALAMAAMRYQTVLRRAEFGGQPWLVLVVEIDGALGIEAWEPSPTETKREAPPDYMVAGNLILGLEGWAKAWAWRCALDEEIGEVVAS